MTTIKSRIETTFEAEGRTFHLFATAGDATYGAHVTEDGTDELAFNGNLRLLPVNADALALLTSYVVAVTDGVVAKAEREAAAEADHETCEHGLSAWLCEGPMHYPQDRELQF